MNKEWEIKRLGEVCNILNGGTPKTGAKEYWDGNVKWITPKDMGKLTSKFVGDTPRKITSLGLQKSSAKLIPSNSLILSTRAPIGHLAINTSEMATNQGCRGIIPLNDINVQYLYYFLSNSIDLLNSLGTGATFRELSTKALSSVKIPLPPIPEQKHIVKILDEAFAAIEKAKANAEKNLQNSRELFDSYLNKVFANPSTSLGTGPGEDWEEKKLGDLAKINYGYTEKASFEKIGPKFLRITDIQNNSVNWVSVPFCKIEKSQLPKYILTNGDIVFARTGATTGKSYLIKNPPDSVFASYLIRLQVQTKDLIPEFVHLFFQTQQYWDNIKIGVSGSAQGGFNATKLSKLKIIFPAVLEQNRIVKKFERLILEIKKLEAIYQQKLADLEELNKSLLQKAFDGEL